MVGMNFLTISKLSDNVVALTHKDLLVEGGFIDLKSLVDEIDSSNRFTTTESHEHPVTEPHIELPVSPNNFIYYRLGSISSYDDGLYLESNENAKDVAKLNYEGTIHGVAKKGIEPTVNHLSVTSVGSNFCSGLGFVTAKRFYTYMYLLLHSNSVPVVFMRADDLTEILGSNKDLVVRDSISVANKVFLKDLEEELEQKDGMRDKTNSLVNYPFKVYGLDRNTVDTFRREF